MRTIDTYPYYSSHRKTGNHKRHGSPSGPGHRRNPIRSSPSTRRSPRRPRPGKRFRRAAVHHSPGRSCIRPQLGSQNISPQLGLTGSLKQTASAQLSAGHESASSRSIGVWPQPMKESHVSSVQQSASTQLIGALSHTPVQGSQPFVVRGSPSSQSTGAFAQLTPEQTSTVQLSTSSQSALTVHPNVFTTVIAAVGWNLFLAQHPYLVHH